jgi:hypothetical protein
MGKSGKDVYSLYIHMVDRERKNVSLDVGTIVKKGQQIGDMYNGGLSAGPYNHLHYSIQYVPDIYEFNYYNNVYPLRSKVYKAGNDKSEVIGGKRYNDILDFLKENYENPEEFYYNHNPILSPNHPYILAKNLEQIEIIPEFLNAEVCSSIWNLNNTSSLASKDKEFAHFQAKLVNGECVYKKNDTDILIRFNPLLKKSFLYDNSEVAGTKSSTYMYNKNPDTMKEFYSSYLTLYKTAKEPIFSELDLEIVKKNFLNEMVTRDHCVSVWNRESMTSLIASSSDLDRDVYVDYDGINCIFISTKSDDYIYFNYKEGVNNFVLGNKKPIHDNLFSRQRIESDLHNSIGNNHLDCSALVSSTNLPSCQFINKHGQYQMNYFHSPHQRDNRMPQFYYFITSIEGISKYIYLSSDGHYAIVYETDMSSFDVVLSSDKIFKSLTNFKYSMESYSQKLESLLNLSKNKRFLNFQNLYLSDTNFVECTKVFISLNNRPNCGNNVIDSDEECASIWRSSFYHSDISHGYTSTLAGNNVCNFKEKISGKIIEFDANLGKVTIIVSPGINLNELNALLNAELQDFYSFQSYMYKDFCDVYLSNLNIINSSNIKAYEWKHNSCFFEDENNLGEFIYIQKYNNLTSVVYNKSSSLNEELQFSKILKETVSILRSNSLLINSSEACNNVERLLPASFKFSFSYYYYYKGSYCSLYMNNKYQVNIMYDGTWFASFS